MNRVRAWALDYLHMLRGNVQMYYHRNPPKHYRKYVIQGKAPVLLIPGIMEKWGFLKNLGDKISLQGHPVYIVTKLGSNLRIIPHAAEIVREVIDENDLKDVILVAHSKGGLIGKYFLIHHNNDKRVKGLIAIAAPFSGSKLAKLIPHHTFKELTPESKIVNDLQSKLSINTRIVSIYPTFDNHVWAEEGSYLKGAENIKVTIHGHHKVLFDKEVQNTVLSSIEKLSK